MATQYAAKWCSILLLNFLPWCVVHFLCDLSIVARLGIVSNYYFFKDCGDVENTRMRQLYQKINKQMKRIAWEIRAFFLICFLSAHAGNKKDSILNLVFRLFCQWSVAWRSATDNELEKLWAQDFRLVEGWKR